MANIRGLYGGSRGGSGSGGSISRRYIDYDTINGVQAQIDEKYAEIERLKKNIKALSAQIGQKYTVLNAMHYLNPGRDGLQQAIEGLKSERSEEQQAIDSLRTVIAELKEKKKRLSYS